MASGFQKNIFQNFKVKAEADIFDFVGSGAPTDGTSGTGVTNAGKGSSYYDTATGYVYINTGTKASPVWSLSALSANLSGALTVTAAGVATLDPALLVKASGTISAADIVSTSAGKFGHAAGQILVAGQGAHNALELVSLVTVYDFAVAAYTGGGNVTVNISGGGAALTGLVSAANSYGAAADNIVVYRPLAAAAAIVTENTGLNLVAASAFTQPGTAAGVIRWVALYRVHATGL